LEYEVRRPAGGPCKFVLVHDRHGGIGELAGLADVLAAHGGVVAPYGFYGEYAMAMALVGRLWFFEWSDVAWPDPVMFGRSLLELETLIIELGSGGVLSEEKVLIGIGQGATLGLALSCVHPELVHSVVAVDPGGADIPGWRPPVNGDVDVRRALYSWRGSATRLSEAESWLSGTSLPYTVSEISPARDVTQLPFEVKLVPPQPFRN
jgi:hypothetical protein